MINFTTEQLSWILIGSISIGGTGYMSLVKQVDNLDTKIQVTQVNTTYTKTQIDELKVQLNRIEEKMDKKSVDKSIKSGCKNIPSECCTNGPYVN